MNPDQFLVSPEEKHRRYQRIRREAATELTNYTHGLAGDNDVYDRFELAHMWKMSCEGFEFSAHTWEQMLEATGI